MVVRCHRDKAFLIYFPAINKKLVKSEAADGDRRLIRFFDLKGFSKVRGVTGAGGLDPVFIIQISVSQCYIFQCYIFQCHIPQFCISQFHISQFHIPQFRISQFHISKFHISQSHIFLQSMKYFVNHSIIRVKLSMENRTQQMEK